MLALPSISSCESEERLKSLRGAGPCENDPVRLLLAEDDPRMRALVRRGLTEEGHAVDAAATGPEAVDLAAAGQFDVLIVDLMLPGYDGVEVVRRLRAQGNRTPALMLTARDGSTDIVASLDAGADDYLVKPFAFAVLLARLRALGRRGPAAHQVTLRVADLSLDSAARAVTRGGQAITLTRTEHNLLEHLMRHAGRVVTRGTLIEQIWGSDRQVEGNTLDAFVKSLRHKIDAPGRVRLIHTVRGVGYSLREEPES
jgi:two-component system, OmpR family, response regulator MprA